MVEHRSVSVNDIALALQELGNNAEVSDIKDKVEEYFGGIPPNYKSRYSFRNTIQALINIHCQQAKTFGGNSLFHRIDHGKYELANQAPVFDDECALSRETLFIEGKSNLSWVVKYERDKRLREAAIRIHNTICEGCGFDFESKYGLLGAGFIEVHHTKPVSLLQGQTIIDPETDLVVLCSNCHSMVHRRRPIPLTIDELKATLCS